MGRAPLWSTVLAFAASLVCCPRTALAAEAKTSSLSWLRMPGADSCVATQPLARAVEERLGRAVFVSAAQADLSVEGRVEKRPRGGWHALITLRNEQGTTLGTREVERPEGACDAMTEPLAFVIAVMIDPDAAMRTKPDPPQATPLPAPAATKSEPSPPAPAAPPPPPVAPPRPPEPWRFEGYVQGNVDHGHAPGFTPGIGINAILYPPKLPLGFRGYTALFLPTTEEVDGARASFDMVYTGGSLCPTLRGRVDLLACLGGRVGVLRAHAETAGRGIREDALLLLTAMAELRLHVRLVHPVGLAAGLGAGIPILRPDVAYARKGDGGAATLHRVEPYALTADIGFGIVLP